MAKFLPHDEWALYTDPAHRAAWVSFERNGWGDRAHAAWAQVPADDPRREAVRRAVEAFPFGPERENVLFPPGYLADCRRRVLAGELGAIHALHYAAQECESAPLIRAVMAAVGMEPHPEDTTTARRLTWWSERVALLGEYA